MSCHARRENRPHPDGVRVFAGTALMLAVVACTPVVAHMPRVQRGGDMALIGVLAAGRAERIDSSISVAMMPAFGMRGSWGWRAAGDSLAAGLEAGVQVVAFTGALADVYAQMPRRWF